MEKMEINNFILQRTLKFTWLSLVRTMIHKCEHYYFTVLGRCTGHFYAFRKRWYDRQGCNGCLKQPLHNVAFERHVFRQAIQETNKPSINFVTRLCKLASTYEFADQNTGIQNHFIDKCSPNCLSCRLLQEPNLTLEEVIEKNQAMERAEKQSIVMYRTKCRLVWQG